ncbi:MAG TPA: HDOD domain-containing protein [Anaeromyxobacter sp.]|nr:HDOD domain-containing protein [Anaeromyxobacter sp.]
MPDPTLSLPAELLDLERAVQGLVARGGLRVPPYPAVAVRVQEALSRREAGLAEISTLVGADAVLAAAILRCANSALYRRGPPVTELLQAITRIGAAEVIRLLLASGLSTSAQAVGALVSVRRVIWIEGLVSAALCQELARLRGLRTEEAFVLGLLHDFGKIVATAALEALVEEGRLEGSWPLEAWTGLVERQHVAVGLAMAERWRLPALVGEVIASHHGGGTCRDPALLEVIRLTDAVVALVLTRTRVTAAELARVPGLTAAERAAVERVIEQVPEFVSAFETAASAAFVGSPRIALPATTLAGGGRPVRIGASISVARRPRLFRVTTVLPDGLIMEGEDPLPENRLLEAKLYAEEPFALWVVTRLCRPTSSGFQVEVQPFALSGPAREGWERLTAGPPA